MKRPSRLTARRLWKRYEASGQQTDFNAYMDAEAARMFGPPEHHSPAGVSGGISPHRTVEGKAKLGETPAPHDAEGSR